MPPRSCRTDETRDLLLLWHSRPGGQNNRGAQWTVPEWFDGELPAALAARSDSFQSEGTRIPGRYLRPDGPMVAGAAAPGDPRQLVPAAAAKI